MLLTNTETIPGYRIKEVKGLVQGNTVRAKHIGRDIMAGFRNLIGGEVSGYTELLTESREQATERMIDHAEDLGANAVVNVRFSTSAITQGAAELYVYGTAVVVVKETET
ncbi:MAG: YbjQ family protein [Planctomycetaceae bacterium]|nr:YbjQ family protein [Planctomycetaceae bacterium]MCA9029329.1 YbjQ family protein [Planctomycetaceae bacterium]MCA9042837.1 YbjQ family protein [Planctomycetaceae bacterium]MCB9950600.1 YbjQ family protein [Planctomycetaceae bacterium]